jgi:predicted PilT family ATPase
MEENIGLRINLETFDDLPILDLDAKIEKNNNTIVMYFPKHFINRNVYIMIGKDLIHTQSNDHAQVIIKKKSLIKIM